MKSYQWNQSFLQHRHDTTTRLQKAVHQGEGEYGTFDKELELKAAKPLPPPTATPTLPDNLVIKVIASEKNTVFYNVYEKATRGKW